jgi:hypothetical protein
MATSDKDYYENASNWGEDQYVTLNNVINNFMVINVGDNKIINDVDRSDIIFHAKRGLQELHYDALKEVQAIEIEMPDDLQIILPRDCVSVIDISWADLNGRLHPMTTSRDMAVINKAFLQDSTGEILFDSEDNALQGTPLTDIRNIDSVVSDDQEVSVRALRDESIGARFGMDTSRANINGTYNINKSLGLVRFSSDVADKLIVLQYISDGLSNVEESSINVHKFAEDYLYKYILYEVVKGKFGIQEYIVTRTKKEWFAAMKNTKIRMMDIHPMDMVQALRGKNKWIK